MGGIHHDERALRRLPDRSALVARHDPRLNAIDPLSPLSVGNGDFCFSADVTGLQTLAEHYEAEGMPLETLSTWAWHSFPNPHNYRMDDVVAYYDSHGRQVPYHSDCDNEAGRWLRSNPHRFNLGRIGFCRLGDGGSSIRPDDVREIDQRLSLWEGRLTSRFHLRGVPVQTEVCCHPDLDLLAIRVQSPGLKEGTLGLELSFPYPTSSKRPPTDDWEAADMHTTDVEVSGPSRYLVRRDLDGQVHYLSVHAPACRMEQVGADVIRCVADSAELVIVVRFGEESAGGPLPGWQHTRDTAAAHGARYWREGGMVDFSGSSDPRAEELERRVILSQYLTAIQCENTVPCGPGGLTCNTYFGKPNLETVMWHAAHFALWGRGKLLAKCMPWYRSILPAARRMAQWQGYEGARWPKAPDPSGREQPMGDAVCMIYHIPYVIYMLELLYRGHPDPAFLCEYAELVEETAMFMGSFAFWEMDRQRYVLGPPILPGQETHRPAETWNVPFDLAIWSWGLEVAQRWREQLGQPRHPLWDRVLRHLSAFAEADGLYLTAETAPDTWTNPVRRTNHYSVLFTYGLLPAVNGMKPETMRRTLHRVLTDWDLDLTFGLSAPLAAMCAARLGETETALDFLFLDHRNNQYATNGHNVFYYAATDSPRPCPSSNGNLLTAIAMMAAGWEGGPDRHAPGFPEKGWVVRWEGLQRYI